MHEIVFLLAALVGIGLLGYLITIITPQLFSSIGLLMLAAGLAEGIPTGFWYHVVLRRILIERGNLPLKWWIHPTRHHAQLSPDEHRRIRLWFVLGGIGYAIALAGGPAPRPSTSRWGTWAGRSARRRRSSASSATGSSVCFASPSGRRTSRATKRRCGSSAGTISPTASTARASIPASKPC